MNDSIKYSRAASTLRKFSDTDRSLVSRLRKNSTEAEEKLWNLVRKDQILGVRFRRQHKVGQFVVDFFSVKCHLAIEVDGEIHAKQVQEDEARTQWLNSMGIRVVRFSNAEVIAEPYRIRVEIEKATHEQLALFRRPA